MRIALLSFEYPAETGFGGIGTYTWYQARALTRLGHEVHVLAGAASPSGVRTEKHDGVRVHRFRVNGKIGEKLKWFDERRLHWSRNRLENALSMYKLFQPLGKQYRYDIIETPECGADGMLVNHLTRIPAVVRLHSPARLIMPFYDVPGSDVTLCATLERVGIHGAAALSSCSAFLAREARNRLGIRRPIRVIPNGIDLELYDRGEEVNLRRLLGLPQDRVVLLFAGRLETRKGIHIMKDIAATILERHEVALVFAGQDLFQYMSQTLLPALQERRLRGSVHYLGKLDHEMVRSAVKQCDVFLLPSLWENCPYACLEAMAAGRAIVSSNRGGMPELIQHEQNGLLAEQTDADSFVACVEQLLADRAQRERLGNAARRTVEERYTDMRIAEETLAFYSERLNGTAPLAGVRSA